MHPLASGGPNEILVALGRIDLLFIFVCLDRTFLSSFPKYAVDLLVASRNDQHVYIKLHAHMYKCTNNDMNLNINIEIGTQTNIRIKIKIEVHI